MNLSHIKASLVLILVSVLATACPSSQPPKAVFADADSVDLDLYEGDALLDGQGGDALDSVDGTEDTAEVGPDTLLPTLPFCLVSPVNGCPGLNEDTVSLTIADDLFPDSPGLQVNVQVDVSQIPPYTAVELWLDGTRLSRQIKSTASELTFSRVSLTHAPQPDCHEMTVRSVGAVALETVKTVCVDTGLCGAVLQPSNGACLTQDADPEGAGFQGQFLLSNDGTICYAGSLVSGTWNSGPLDLSSGSSPALLTLADSAEGHGCTEVTVQATVEDATNSDRLVNIQVPYRISTLRPKLTFVQPLKKVLNLSDDLDNDGANGVQVAVVANIESVGAQDTVILELDGQPVSSVLGASGAASFGDITLSTEGLHTLDLVVTDSCCGLETRTSLQVVLLLAQANLALVLPVDGSLLPAADDEDPTTSRIYETAFLIYAPVTQPGQTITVQCRRDAAGAKIWFTVGTLTVAQASEDFTYLVPVDLDTGRFGNSIECWARDSTPFYTQLSRFRVGIPGPVFKILDPPQASTHPGEALPIVVQTANLGGRVFTMTLTGPTGVLSSEEVTLGATGLQLVKDLTAAEDGDYTLAFEGTDQWGNNPADLPGNLTTVTFSIDNRKPRVEFVDPPAGSVCTVDTCPDADPVAPGYQLNLGLRVLDELHPERSRVCLTGDNLEKTCATPDAEGSVLVNGVLFTAGLNQLTAVVTDAAGWVSDPVNYELTLDYDAPSVRILTPPPTTYLLSSSVEVRVKVTNPKTAATYNDATVAIRLNGLEIERLPAGVGGVYVFNVPGLTADTFSSIQAFATHPNHAYEGASGLRRVFYKTSRPVIHWVSPAGSTTLNLASPECAPGSGDCRINLTAAIDNAEDDSLAELTISCVVLPEAARKVLVKDGRAVWTVTLPSAGECVLGASVADLAGQVAVSVQITLSLDRVAPTIYNFQSPISELMPVALDEDPVAAGYQLTPEVTVGGVEKNQLLTLTITRLDDATVQTLTVPVPSDVADDKGLRVKFPQHTFQDTTYSLLVSVADKAGNASTLTRISQFYLTNIVLKIDAPTFVEKKACANDNECTGGTICQLTGTISECVRPATRDGVFVRISTAPGDLFQGSNNLRVCSDSVGFKGRPLCNSTIGSTALYVVETRNHSGGVDAILFPAPEAVDGFPQGLHNVVIEVKRNDSDEWVSSLAAPNFTQQYRWFWVDTNGPTLASASFIGDILPPVGVLNAAEQAAPGAIYDLGVTGSDLAGGSLDIWLNGVQFPATNLAADAFSMRLQLFQNLNSLSLVAKDRHGNQSATLPLEITVDTVPPAVSFFRPTGSPLALGSSADVIVSATGGDGRPVVLSRDVDGTLTQLGSLVPGGDKSATFSGVLQADGLYRLLASITDLAGNNTTRGTSPETILVDRTPPQVLITLPADGSVLDDGDDAAPGTPGFQAGLNFSIQGALSYKILVSACTDATFTTCAAEVLAREGVTGTEDGQSLTEAVNISGLESTSEFRVLRVEALDGATNTVSASIKVSIQLTNCLISVVGLPDSGWVNASACPNPQAGCASASVPLGVSFSAACGDADAFEVLKNGASLGTAALNATLPVTFNDAVPVELEVLLLLAGTPTGQSTGELPISVDLTPPVITWISPAVDKLSCNAAEDAKPEAPGLQGSFSAQVAGDNLAGRPLTLVYNNGGADTTASTVSIGATPFDATFTEVSLPEGKTVIVKVLATDEAGNTTTLSRTLNIDVTAPSPIDLKPIVEETDINRRRPEVLLTWNAVGDDALEGSAAVTYDLRYSRAPITNENFTLACAAQDINDDNDLPNPGVPGALESFALSGPDLRPNGDPCVFQPLSTPGQRYYFAVRATDDVGNTSQVGGERFTEALSLRYTQIKATGIDSIGTSALPASVGDFDGDGLKDLVIGSFSPTSGLCLVLGRDNLPATLEIKTDPLTSCVFDSYASQVGASVYPLGDINGDGLADFGIRVQRNQDNTVAPLIRIYLGDESGTLPAVPDLQLRYGTQPYTAAQFTLAGAGNFTGDLNGVRPVDDLLVGVYLQGKAFVIPGSVSWVRGSNLVIDLSKADDLEAWHVGVLQLAGVPTTERFGHYVGRVGDVLQDTGEAYDDILVTRSVVPNTAAYIIAGRPLPATTVISLSSALDGSQVADADAVRLLPDSGLETYAGFCAEIFGGVDFNDDGQPDVGCNHLLAGAQSKKSIYIFAGTAVAGARGGSLKVNGNQKISDDTWKGAGGMVIAGNFGNAKLAGNFDDAPADVSTSVDLVYGDYNGWVKFGNVYLRLNRAAQGQAVPFPIVSLHLKDPFNPEGTSFGGQKIAPLGDFNGDGFVDLSVGVDIGATYQVLVY
jgi:hypothetical protein